MNRNSRSLLRGWSLETKCLVALGLALAISFVFAMFLMHWIADRLVRETTRVAARNLALSVIVNRHITAFSTAPSPADELPSPGREFDHDALTEHQLENRALLKALQSQLKLSAEDYVLLRLDDGRQWKNLQGEIPENSIDLRKLFQLESELPKVYRTSNAPEPVQMTVAAESNTIEAGTVESIDSDALPTEEVTSTNQDRLSFRLSGPSADEVPFEEYGPAKGFYYYYYPIRFSNECTACHTLLSENGVAVEAASSDLRPFRAVRIQMPYEATRVWTIWIYSSMIAVAVATLSIALFLEHRILKRLVIRPLHYLRDVTDRVAVGETNIRSNIATKDEFQSLSDSLNHMLRNLIDAQTNLENANQKLDLQVDEMARVNFELFEANRLKSEFLANMSHELRTPLNSILGFSDVLQGIDSLTEKQKRYAANIQKSGRILLDMINDILDLAKIEAGKMQVRCSDFDLEEVVHGQCELIRSLSDEKNIDVKVICQVDANREQATWVYQDKGKLQQILNNLLSNAIKFTPEGGFVTVDIAFPTEEYLTISVKDTGVGIAEADQETVFEKFRQVRSKDSADSLTREVTGTGLGLSITKELCKLLGGEIAVESELGKGSNFIVELPIRFQVASPVP